MSNDPISLGQAGESAALFYLKKHGFQILEKNWRSRTAELDIIAKDRNTICFIEVKTRRSIKRGLPREAVTPAKQNKIIRAALLYLKKKRHTDVPVRFDVVEVLESHGQLSVNLIKNAFQAY